MANIRYKVNICAENIRIIEDAVKSIKNEYNHICILLERYPLEMFFDNNRIRFFVDKKSDVDVLINDLEVQLNIYEISR